MPRDPSIATAPTGKEGLSIHCHRGYIYKKKKSCVSNYLDFLLFFCVVVVIYSDGLMTVADFGALCRTLFRNEQGKAYVIDDTRLQEMFDVFDRNQVLPGNAVYMSCYSLLQCTGVQR